MFRDVDRPRYAYGSVMCAGERPSVDLGEIGWQRDRAQGGAAHHVSVASLPPVTVAVTVAIKLRCPNTSTAPRSLATVAASGLAAAGSVQVGEHVGGPLRVGREECHVFEVLWPGTFRNVLHQSAQQILARTVALLHDCTIARLHDFTESVEHLVPATQELGRHPTAAESSPLWSPSPGAGRIFFWGVCLIWPPPPGGYGCGWTIKSVPFPGRSVSQLCQEGAIAPG